MLNYVTVTLDNNLIRNRSKDLQNKMISSRKAAKEDHIADILHKNF